MDLIIAIESHRRLHGQNGARLPADDAYTESNTGSGSKISTWVFRGAMGGAVLASVTTTVLFVNRCITEESQSDCSDVISKVEGVVVGGGLGLFMGGLGGLGAFGFQKFVHWYRSRSDNM